MSKRAAYLMWTVIIACISTFAQATERDFSYSVTPYIGVHDFDNVRDFKDRPEVGIRFEKFLNNTWGIEAGAGYVPTEKKSTGKSKDGVTYSLNGTFNILLGKSDFVPYLTAGLGGDYIHNSKNGPNAGIGARWFLTDTIALRPEVRYINLFKPATKGREDYLVTLGLNFLFGKAAKAAAPAPAPAPAPVPVVADTDKDGVPDSLDKCPDSPAGSKVDGTGCPPDSDRDGVPDSLDKCPNSPAGSKVDGTGCPPDSDRDGVPDSLDKCPDTPAGARVDEAGCVESITLKVNFDTAKWVVKREYNAEIEQFAAYLKKYPEVKAEIQGHTDNLGDPKKNVALSQKRANAIVDMLIQKHGIDRTRLSAKGYGQDKPIASNATPEGREKNRRVEAVIIK